MLQPGLGVGGDIARMAGDVRPIATTLTERDEPEDMFTPQQNYQRNQGWARPGPYQTQLAPPEESAFQQWAHQQGIQLQDYTGPHAVYDMRGFWKAQQAGDERAVARPNQNDIDPQTGQGRRHFPDIWKTPYAATFSNESIYALPNAPVWGQGPSGGDVYALPNGHIIFDDVMGRWFGLPK